MAIVCALVLGGAACASSPAGGGDAGAGEDAPPSVIDAGVDATVGPAAITFGAFCGGGGRSRGGSGPGSPVHIGCTAPADLAAHARRQGSITWQPGPIYRVTP